MESDIGRKLGKYRSHSCEEFGFSRGLSMYGLADYMELGVNRGFNEYGWDNYTEVKTVTIALNRSKK